VISISEEEIGAIACQSRRSGVSSLVCAIEIGVKTKMCNAKVRKSVVKRGPEEGLQCLKAYIQYRDVTEHKTNPTISQKCSLHSVL